MAEAGRLALGVESGGTGSRWSLADSSGATVASGSIATLTGHVFTDSDRRQAASVLDSLRDAILSHGRPSCILAGLTGLGPTSAVADFLRDELARRFAIPPEAIRLVDDMWLAYRAHFEPGEGIVVSAGTGSIAYHLAADGTIVRAGGHGILIDDAGGGAWIGARALRAILQLEDEARGSGWETVLGRRIGAEIGGASWDAARIFVYGGNRGSLGLLARSVAQAAAKGDALACGIFEEAGNELGRLAVTLRRRLGSLPVALIGRAAYLDPRVAESFVRAVAPPVRLDAGPRDIAAVAARLAPPATEHQGIG